MFSKMLVLITVLMILLIIYGGNYFTIYIVLEIEMFMSFVSIQERESR